MVDDFLEAWHINASPWALNRDDGSCLPQEYLHLDDVTLTVYKVMSFNIRSPLIKTLDRSVATLSREFIDLFIVASFYKQNRSTYYAGLYTLLRYCHKFQFKV